MSAAIHLLRPLPIRPRESTATDADTLAAQRVAEADAERAMIAHHFLSQRARLLLPNCTEAERVEVQRLIDAGPRSGLRDAVLHLELAGVSLAPESKCV